MSMQLMMARARINHSGSPVITQTLFDASKKASDVVLDVNGRKVSTTATGQTGGQILSVSGKTSGKFYAEIICLATGSTPSIYASTAAGISNTTGSLTTYLGGNSNTWASWSEDYNQVTRDAYHSGNRSYPTSVTGGALVGQTARIALDIDAGNLWMSAFGGSGWMNGGDPAAGTSPSYSGLAAGTYYLAANPRGPGNILQLTLPTAWAYTPPAGFGVWT